MRFVSLSFFTRWRYRRNDLYTIFWDAAAFLLMLSDDDGLPIKAQNLTEKRFGRLAIIEFKSNVATPPYIQGLLVRMQADHRDPYYKAR